MKVSVAYFKNEGLTTAQFEISEMKDVSDWFKDSGIKICDVVSFGFKNDDCLRFRDELSELFKGVIGVEEKLDELSKMSASQLLDRLVRIMLYLHSSIGIGIMGGKEYEEAIIKKMRIATVMNAKGWVPDEYYLQMVFNDAFFKWDESKIKEE